MKPKLVIIIFGVLLAVIGFYVFRHCYVVMHDITQEIFGTQQLRDAFISSDQVTAQRLRHREGRPMGSDDLDYYEKESPVPVTGSWPQEIKSLLQRESSYDWSTGTAKSCILDYGVLITFRSSQRTVRVAICFNCNQLGIYDGSDNTAKRVNAEMDFDPIRKELVTVAKFIFLKDSDIQELR